MTGMGMIAWSGEPGRHIVEVIGEGGTLECSQIATASWLLWDSDGSFDDCNANTLLDELGYTPTGSWKQEGNRWWAGIKKVAGMDFSDALTTMKQGGKVTRRYWQENPVGMGWTLEIAQVSLADGRPAQPQLLCQRSDGTMAVFSGAVMDLLAKDWEVVETGEKTEQWQTSR